MLGKRPDGNGPAEPPAERVADFSAGAAPATPQLVASDESLKQALAEGGAKVQAIRSDHHASDRAMLARFSSIHSDAHHADHAMLGSPDSHQHRIGSIMPVHVARVARPSPSPPPPKPGLLVRVLRWFGMRRSR